MFLLLLIFRILLNLGVGAALGLGVILAPLPAALGEAIQHIQTPLGVLIIVCGLGKALYDTLFWDRYATQ
jgi:hypothetical protein